VRTPPHSPEPGVPDSARVEELLDRQRLLLERLEALSLHQGELIDRDDSARLLDLLAQRQHLVDGIADLNAALEPHRARWPAVLSAMAEAERDRVNRKLDALSDLAGRLAERDEADRLRLERRRDAVSAELRNVTRGRGAVAAYALGAARAIFQDREA
jgi:hypothetical protein